MREDSRLLLATRYLKGTKPRTYCPRGKGYALGRYLDKLSHLTLLARAYFYGCIFQILVGEWGGSGVCGKIAVPSSLSDQHRGMGDLELVLFLFVPVALCYFEWLLLSGFRNTICLPGLFVSQNEMGCYKNFSPSFAGVEVTSISDCEVLSGSKACIKHQYWQLDYCGLSCLLTCRPLNFVMEEQAWLWSEPYHHKTVYSHLLAPARWSFMDSVAAVHHYTDLNQSISSEHAHIVETGAHSWIL